MLKDGPLLSPDRIGTDGAGTYPGAIAAARRVGRLARDPVHHVTKHLRQGIEGDHSRLKKDMPRVGGFRSFNTARRSVQWFEAMLWMRRGFGFADPWNVVEQNRMHGLCFDFRRSTRREIGVVQARSTTHSGTCDKSSTTCAKSTLLRSRSPPRGRSRTRPRRRSARRPR